MAKNASRLISFRVSSSSSSSSSSLSSSFSSRRLLSTETKTSIKDGTSSLYSRIAALGGTDTNVAETLNEWVKEGKPLLKRDVISFATQLRKYKKYTHAIQLLEWLEKRDGDLARGDHAIRLDLLAKAEGIESAENYFAKLPESCKNKLTYGALLNCYSKARMTEKAMAHFEKMKELNFASTCLAYNNLMALYIRVGEPEKVLQLLEEMKEKDIKPDVYTYNFVMNSYAATKDIEGVEKAMEDMKKLGVRCDWSTYANLASIYIKADLLDKASKVLKDLEKKNDLRDRKNHHILIGLYAYTSNKLGIYRIWESLTSAYPTITNLSYLILLQALYKLGDIDGLKKYFEEWESSCSSYDIRLANILIDYYLSQDMLQEAESLQESAVTRGATPNSRSLEAFMDFYLKKGDGKSALKCLETAASTVKNHKWKPTQETVRMFTKYFEEEKDVDGAEKFCMRLKKINKLNSEVYDSLIRTYIAAGEKEPRMLQRMKEDGIELNPGTKKLLGRVCPQSSE